MNNEHRYYHLIDQDKEIAVPKNLESPENSIEIMYNDFIKAGNIRKNGDFVTVDQNGKVKKQNLNDITKSIKWYQSIKNENGVRKLINADKSTLSSILKIKRKELLNGKVFEYDDVKFTSDEKTYNALNGYVQAYQRKKKEFTIPWLNDDIWYDVSLTTIRKGFEDILEYRLEIFSVSRDMQLMIDEGKVPDIPNWSCEELT